MSDTKEKDPDEVSDSGHSFTFLNNPSVAESTVSTKCSTASFYDIQTGAIIPADRIMEVMDKIDQLQHKLEQGRLIFRDVKKRTGDSNAAALASNQASGGSMTRLYDQLCRERVLICMTVTLPPAKDQEEMFSNERKLRILIAQNDEHLAKSIIDCFTSRFEVGSVSQNTVCYVRFAYFLGPQVQHCAQNICKTSIQTHQFHASVSFAGRNKLYPSACQQVTQWDSKINGHVMPALPVAEATAIIQHDGKATFSERIKAQMAEAEANTFTMDSDKVSEEMKQFFWATEEKHLINTTTFALMTQLKSPTNADKVTAMFHIYGQVITAGRMGVVPHDTLKVNIYGCIRSLDFPEASLFLPHQPGCRYITFDQPWTLKMGAAPGLTCDDHWHAETGKTWTDGMVGVKASGLKVVYCFKYNVTGAGEIQLFNSGIMFTQHLSLHNHFVQLWALADICKSKMGDLGAQMSQMQRGTSSASGSTGPLAALLPH